LVRGSGKQLKFNPRELIQVDTTDEDKSGDRESDDDYLAGFSPLSDYEVDKEFSDHDLYGVDDEEPQPGPSSAMAGRGGKFNCTAFMHAKDPNLYEAGPVTEPLDLAIGRGPQEEPKTGLNDDEDTVELPNSDGLVEWMNSGGNDYFLQLLGIPPPL